MTFPANKDEIIEELKKQSNIQDKEEILVVLQKYTTKKQSHSEANRKDFENKEAILKILKNKKIVEYQKASNVTTKAKLLSLFNR